MKRLCEWFLYKGKAVRIAPYDPDKPGYGAIISPYGRECYFRSFGLLWNWRAAWVGAHYSPHHKRWCVNIVPFLTVWWTKPGGYLP